MAPSIPTPGQAYGYEENDDGSLRKQEPPEKDRSIGPAYYKVANVSSLNLCIIRHLFSGADMAFSQAVLSFHFLSCFCK